MDQQHCPKLRIYFDRHFSSPRVEYNESHCWKRRGTSFNEIEMYRYFLNFTYKTSNVVEQSVEQ